MQREEEPPGGAPPQPSPRDDESVSRILLAGRRLPLVVRVARWTAAVLLVLVGMSMVVVPGIPGPPFFLAALLLVAADFAPARRLAVKMQRKIPPFRRIFPRALRRLARKDRR
jgi:hypothetical protein